MEQQGKKNAYICETCGKQIVTVNLEDGVTPFMIQCRANWPGACHGMAKSSFYRIDQELSPEWGWYRPVGFELTRLDPSVRQHVDNGGLLLRKLDSAEREQHGAQRVRRG